MPLASHTLYAALCSPTVVPLEVTTGDVGTGCTAAGEAYEGLLVVVRGVTLLSEPNNYGEVEMDDGSGATQLEDGMLDTDTHLESVLGVASLTGQTVESITGVVRFAFGSFEIHPRSEADIEVAGGGDAAAYTIVEINSNHDEQNTGCYHCLLYTSPSPRDQRGSRMPSSA